ncbi:YceI family protein [Eudoraea sp.]|uniref:YceI family protein n=1 Tax=Eudoraea sp. TaxID=1979955 RepID=UPI003C71936E
MKYFCISLLFFLLTLPEKGLEPLPQTTAEIRFSFISKNVEGTIEGFEFNGEITPANWEVSNFEGSVTVETIKTGNFIRDWHLKNRKYFNQSEFPFISFKSTSVEIEDGSIKVSGTLKIKDIAKPIIWIFKKEGNTLKGSSTIYTSDFDINIQKNREDNKVDIFMNLIL